MTSKRSKRKANSSMNKGKLVEQIVSTLYADPDIKVEKNARLVATNSKSRKREIDILISKNETVQTVVECKNYNKIIDAPLIDAFLGKLDDIGVSTDCGVFVSIKGFTIGAIERASKANIKTLVLTGLSEDRTSAQSDNALQFIVFLLPNVVTMSIHFEQPVPNALSRLPVLCDASGKIRGTLFDFFWKKWIEGEPVSTLGEHNVKIELLGDYYMPIGEKLERLEKVMWINGVVEVTGLVLSAIGVSKEHLLINQANKQVERYNKGATFNQPHGVQEILSFKSENDLRQFVNHQTAAIKLTMGRNRLPRIKATSLYWPLSKRAFDEIFRAYRMFQNGDLPEFDIAKLTHIEGTDLRTAWEPIWDENPILGEFSATQIRLLS